MTIKLSINTWEFNITSVNICVFFTAWWNFLWILEIICNCWACLFLLGQWRLFTLIVWKCCYFSVLLPFSQHKFTMQFPFFIYIHHPKRIKTATRTFELFMSDWKKEYKRYKKWEECFIFMMLSMNLWDNIENASTLQ